MLSSLTTPVVVVQFQELSFPASNAPTASMK